MPPHANLLLLVTHRQKYFTPQIVKNGYSPCKYTLAQAISLLVQRQVKILVVSDKFFLAVI